MRTVKRALLGLVGLLACVEAGSATFEGGNLVVVRVGDGKAVPSKGSAVAVFLDEINPGTGAVARSIPLPTESRGVRRRLTLSFTATSEGQLATSGDGRYLTLAGYDAPLEMAKLPGSPSDSVPRVVARVDAAGRIDTSTTITDGYSKNNVRGAVTVDGLRFSLAGAGSGGGSRSVEFGGGASTLLSPSPSNTRGVAIFEGQLYASVASGEAKGIVAVGRGVGPEEGQVSTIVALAPAAVEPKPAPDPGSTPAPGPVQAKPVAAIDPKPTGFVFLGGKLYVADVESGLLIYERDEVGEAGLPRYKLAARRDLRNLACLAGRVVDGQPVLYGTDGERLVRFEFEGPDIAIREVARAGPNRAFRGVAFAPTVFDEPAVSLPAVVALGLAGLTLPGAAILALRRKARRRPRFEGTDILVDGGPIG